MPAGHPAPPSCPVYDQQEEDIDHPLLGCDQGLASPSLGLGGVGTSSRWPLCGLATGQDGGELWTTITLTCWCLCTHWNSVVFEGRGWQSDQDDRSGSGASADEKVFSANVWLGLREGDRIHLLIESLTHTISWTLPAVRDIKSPFVCIK